LARISEKGKEITVGDIHLELKGGEFS